MAMEATGVKSYSVFKKHFDDLVSFGFFEVAEYSKNQYSSNVIALKENYKANVKALDKALSKHASKQVQSISESTGKSIVSIDIPINKETIQPINKESAHIPTLEECCQASQMSGYTAKQGEAYFHFRAKDDWMVAKGTAGVMHPIKNWRSDMVHVISKGYLERENPKDKYGNEAVNHHAGYYGKELK
jgi:cyclopropane fatty-acyl-phospholipid synthase-like methyltransferase